MDGRWMIGGLRDAPRMKQGSVSKALRWSSTSCLKSLTRKPNSSMSPLNPPESPWPQWSCPNTVFQMGGFDERWCGMVSHTHTTPGATFKYPQPRSMSHSLHTLRFPTILPTRVALLGERVGQAAVPPDVLVDAVAQEDDRQRLGPVGGDPRAVVCMQGVCRFALVCQSQPDCPSFGTGPLAAAVDVNNAPARPIQEQTEQNAAHATRLTGQRGGPRAGWT